MSIAFTRRAALIGAASLLPATMLQPGRSQAASLDASTLKNAEARFAALEKKNGGRLGVMVLDTGSNAHIGHRTDERFAICSTFKFLAAAAILKRVDLGQEHLDRKVPYGQSDLLSYAPVTKAHVAEGGMSLGELCAAAVEWSDNTAANLMLAALGGPSGVTNFVRSLGDLVTRLDRTEPTLNTAIAGDKRDTTSPRAMLGDMKRLVLEDGLSATSRQQLRDWMVACQTGGKRLRAGLPAAWRVGDKTGTGDNKTANTIAVLWPPKGAPLLATVYYTGSTLAADGLDGVHAEIGRIIAETFAA
jgi:beta-lactamase class A